MIRIRLKIAKKCGVYLDIFSCVKMNIFRSFFAFRLEMHVRCDNQYKTGADRENIFGQPVLFVCMGICVLSPAHESEMRGYLGFFCFFFGKVNFKQFVFVVAFSSRVRNFGKMFDNSFPACAFFSFFLFFFSLLNG